jgi:hypothetical protein
MNYALTPKGVLAVTKPFDIEDFAGYPGDWIQLAVLSQLLHKSVTSDAEIRERLETYRDPLGWTVSDPDAVYYTSWWPRFRADPTPTMTFYVKQGYVKIVSTQ